MSHHDDDDDLSTILRRLSQAPSLNGGWDRMRSDISGLEGDIKDIRLTLCSQDARLQAVDLKLGALIKIGYIIVAAVVGAMAKELIGLL